MNIKILKSNNLLILHYCPQYDVLPMLKDKFEKREKFIVKKTFHLDEESYLCKNTDYNENEIGYSFQKLNEDLYDGEMYFKLGELSGDYYVVKGVKLNINNDVYFHKDVNILQKHFTAYVNTTPLSVFLNISKVFNCDIYIDSDNVSSEMDNHIPNKIFLHLINEIPTKYEIDRYKYSRIENIFSDYLESVENFQVKYEKYMEKKYLENKDIQTVEDRYFNDLKIKGIQESISIIERNLNLNISEKEWQRILLPIVKFLNPKYVFVSREKYLGEKHGKGKYVDFVLVDACGYIDLLEIKTPTKNPLKPTQYRNNFVPSNELSGTIVQLEKYIFTLQDSKHKQAVLKKIKSELDTDIELDIVNPKGIIILGRSNDFEKQQKDDFELIKRQYNNIADILTYDDLLRRLQTMLQQFSTQQTEITELDKIDET